MCPDFMGVLSDINLVPGMAPPSIAATWWRHDPLLHRRNCGRNGLRLVLKLPHEDVILGWGWP